MIFINKQAKSFETDAKYVSRNNLYNALLLSVMLSSSILVLNNKQQRLKIILQTWQPAPLVIFHPTSISCIKVQTTKINLQTTKIKTTNLTARSTGDIEEAVLALLTHVPVHVRTTRALARGRVALKLGLWSLIFDNWSLTFDLGQQVQPRCIQCQNFCL